MKAAVNAVKGTLADQWKEFFYCESMSSEILVRKGQKKVNGRSQNKGDDNIITQGSGIAVADGQCMIIVDNGKILDVCAEPGEYEFNISGEPSIFAGDLGESIKETFFSMVDRVAHGGITARDTRVYYFNTKEIVGNRYGTPSPVPFRVVDRNIGLDIDVSIRCNGEYSYKIIDPLLFYSNVCGNVIVEYRRGGIDSTLRTELMTALQPAFAKISEMGVRYSALPGHTLEIADALNEVLSKKWTELRGIKVASFGINSVTIPPEDERMIKDLQRKAVNRDPSMAAATIVEAQSAAMQSAAKNSGGAMVGFMGMNMAQQQGGFNANDLYGMAQQQQAPEDEQMIKNLQRSKAINLDPSMAAATMVETQSAAMQSAAKNSSGAMVGFMGMDMAQQQGGFNANDLYGMAQQQQAQQTPAAGSWTCSCGEVNTGKFCSECAKPKPAADGAWKCSCGAENTTKFCSECGNPKPNHDGWTCSCGAVNKGKFCSECGKPKPVGEPVYKCDKCGWEPADPKNPPKFCPECGDIFDDNDKQG